MKLFNFVRKHTVMTVSKELKMGSFHYMYHAPNNICATIQTICMASQTVVLSSDCGKIVLSLIFISNVQINVITGKLLGLFSTKNTHG